jgi:hypothetical protein
MGPTHDARFRSAHKHLDVFESGWKAEHHEAMALYDFQEFLAEGLGLFEWLTERSQDFRWLIFVGKLDADPVAAQNEKAMFQRWLHTAAECERNLEHFETRFGMVEGAEKFRLAVAEIGKFLANWQPPVKSLARGLRARRLSDEEVVARRSLLASP